MGNVAEECCRGILQRLQRLRGLSGRKSTRGGSQIRGCKTWHDDRELGAKTDPDTGVCGQAICDDFFRFKCSGTGKSVKEYASTGNFNFNEERSESSSSNISLYRRQIEQPRLLRSKMHSTALIGSAANCNTYGTPSLQSSLKLLVQFLHTLELDNLSHSSK
eukprot:IDg118t1